MVPLKLSENALRNRYIRRREIPAYLIGVYFEGLPRETARAYCGTIYEDSSFIRAQLTTLKFIFAASHFARGN